MKNIAIKRTKLKAFSVIALIVISILYNSYYHMGASREESSNRPIAEVAHADNSQESSVQQLIDFTKTIILSGIKQTISHH